MKNKELTDNLIQSLIIYLSDNGYMYYGLGEVLIDGKFPLYFSKDKNEFRIFINPYLEGVNKIMDTFEHEATLSEKGFLRDLLDTFKADYKKYCDLPIRCDFCTNEDYFISEEVTLQLEHETIKPFVDIRIELENNQIDCFYGIVDGSGDTKGEWTKSLDINFCPICGRELK